MGSRTVSVTRERVGDEVFTGAARLQIGKFPNGTASVKAQKTLDLVNGRYGDLSYTTYPWELNTDNTFNVDMVFDYQLTMEHPDLVRNGRVTMKIYSGKEKKPDITNLTLMRNPVTGTFDGTLTLPAAFPVPPGPVR